MDSSKPKQQQRPVFAVLTYLSSFYEAELQLYVQQLYGSWDVRAPFSRDSSLDLILKKENVRYKNTVKNDKELH